MSLLFSLAVGTSLIQAALMPILLVFCARWTAQNLMKPGSEKKTGSTNEPPVQRPEVKLAPLSCVACGAGLDLGSGNLICSHCGAVTEEPPDYRETFELRRRSLQQLHQASIYIRRASRLSSPAIKWSLVLLGIWLFATPIIMMIGGETDKRYDGIYEKLGSASTFVILSIGLWVMVFFFTAIMITKVRRKLPAISDWSQLGSEERSQCPACGGGLKFGKGDLGALCGFCGVQTMRPQVVWRARKSAAADSMNTEQSLAGAKKAAESAIDDLIGTPAIMIFLLIFLPLLLASPYLLYLAFQEWPAVTAGSVLGAILLVWIFTKLKAPKD